MTPKDTDEMKRIKVKSKGSFKYALVDADQFEILSKYSWYLDSRKCNGRALRSQRVSGKNRTYSMSRQVMGIHETHFGDSSVHVDHINRNTLDNRKSNLRICTASQNRANIPKQRNATHSKYKGVYKQHNSKNKWRVAINVNKKVIRLGCFFKEKDAAIAYDKAAIKYFGEFALTNFKYPSHEKDDE